MAYATLTDSDEETAAALGYWAAPYLPLGAPTGAPPITDDPLSVLLGLYDSPAFRGIETERDLLWHFMRETARRPEFAPVIDRLAIGPATRARVAAVSLDNTSAPSGTVDLTKQDTLSFIANSGTQNLTTYQIRQLIVEVLV